MLRGRGYDLGAEGCKVGGERHNPFTELGIVYGEGVGLDDDDFVDGLGIAESLFEQFVGPRRLCTAAEGELRCGGGLKKVYKFEVETESCVVGESTPPMTARMSQIATTRNGLRALTPARYLVIVALFAPT